MYDASFPPPDPHLDACAFYIGGDTPHIWSDPEIAAQSARWRLPIYVCSDPSGRDGAADAAGAVAWLRAHAVPPGAAVALDYETAVDGAYVIAFDQAVTAAGWTLLLYGSLDAVTQNPRPSAGYWTASWTGTEHLDSGAAATQWANDTLLGQPYDLSEVSDSLALWDTQAPAPAPVPVPAELPMEFLAAVGADPANPSVNQGIWLWNDGRYAHVGDPADRDAFVSLGIKEISLTFATHQALLATQTAPSAAAPTLAGTVPVTVTGTAELTVG